MFIINKIRNINNFFFNKDKKTYNRTETSFYNYIGLICHFILFNLFQYFTEFIKFFAICFETYKSQNSF